MAGPSISVIRRISTSSAASRYAFIIATIWSTGGASGSPAPIARACASASTSAYTARNSASLPAKWWYTAPLVTRAAAAISSTDVCA